MTMQELLIPAAFALMIWLYQLRQDLAGLKKSVDELSDKIAELGKVNSELMQELERERPRCEIEGSLK